MDETVRSSSPTFFHTHRPYHLCRSGAETAVVFIHGFMGSPCQFDPLLPMVLDAGCSAVGLLLPGHGGRARDFAGSGMAAWQEHVDRALEALRRQYARLLLVGHSMGCLLSIHAAVQQPSQLSGILALAPPLYLRVSLQGLYDNLRVGLHWIDPEDARMAIAVATCGVEGVTPINAVSFLPRLLDLYRLSRASLVETPQLTVPVTMLFSAHDEWVSRQSIRFARSLQTPSPEPVRIGLLRDSGHFYYTDGDMERIRRCLRRMLPRGAGWTRAAARED